MVKANNQFLAQVLSCSAGLGRLDFEMTSYRDCSC